jgi:hypothetical protein
MSPQFDGLADNAQPRKKTAAQRLAARFVPAITPDGPLSWAIVLITHRIKKELSICQSSLCLDLVSFPVLSQIKPQAPAGSVSQAFSCKETLTPLARRSMSARLDRLSGRLARALRPPVDYRFGRGRLYLKPNETERRQYEDHFFLCLAHRHLVCELRP